MYQVWALATRVGFDKECRLYLVINAADECSLFRADPLRDFRSGAAVCDVNPTARTGRSGI